MDSGTDQGFLGQKAVCLFTVKKTPGEYIYIYIYSAGEKWVRGSGVVGKLGKGQKRSSLSPKKSNSSLQPLLSLTHPDSHKRVQGRSKHTEESS